MTSKIQSKILRNIAGYYSQKTLPENHKNKYAVINAIHQEMGWGNTSNSFFAFICDLLGFMTPKGAEIAKAMRVYKADTYQDLSEKIHKVMTPLKNASNDQVQKGKASIHEYANTHFPQFSKEEIDYFIDNVKECDEIIIKLNKTDFKATNIAWKQITTPMHKKLEEEHRKRANNIALVENNPVADKSCKASVNHNVGYGCFIGICTSSDWKTPKLFNYENNQWKGNIPLGEEFKFVIVQNSQIIAWEKSDNRILTKQEGEIDLAQGELKF